MTPRKLRVHKSSAGKCDAVVFKLEHLGRTVSDSLMRPLLVMSERLWQRSLQQSWTKSKQVHPTNCTARRIILACKEWNVTECDRCSSLSITVCKFLVVPASRKSRRAGDNECSSMIERLYESRDAIVQWEAGTTETVARWTVGCWVEDTSLHRSRTCQFVTARRRSLSSVALVSSSGK